MTLKSVKPEELLTEKQKKMLYAKAREYGLNSEEFKAFLKKMGYESVKDIRGDEVDNVLNEMVEYAKASKEKIGILFKVAQEHTLHISDLKALIKEFGYKSFSDIPSDKLELILNAIPEYADRKHREILDEFRNIYG